MAGAPLYTQQFDVPDAPQASVRPIEAAVPNASGIGEAIAGAAEKVSAFAVKMEAAKQETASSTARADFLQQITDAQNKAVQSTDYENAPKQFAAERTRLEGEALAKVSDPQTQSWLKLHLAVAGISAQGKVEAAALTRQRDASDTALRSSTEDLQARAAAAGSPTERQELVGVAHGAIEAAARAGTIDASTAFNRKALFDHGLDTALVARSMRTDPAGTLAALNDPEKFDALTPFERETLKAQAIAAHDERTRLQADDLAKRDPAIAAARYGTVTTRALADQLYSRVIIPHESGGDPNAIGKDGEAGLGQIMPDTARAQAKKLGIADLEGKSDAQVREALKNPDLNIKLGGAEWRDNLQRYGGNVWAAAAAYNKGAGRADAWDAAARAQYGDHYSAAQLASVMDSDVGKNYVLAVAQRMGADVTAAPLSFRGSYGAAAAVTQQLEHQANLQRSQDNALISLGQPERDSIAAAFQKGYAVDPESIQRIKQPLIDAAARGNTDATVKLRQFEDAQATYPLVVEAYKHPPEQVEAAVAGLRAHVEKNGGTAQDLRRLEVLEKVSKVMNDARQNNPVGLIERQLGPQSVTQVAPPQSPADPAFGASLAARSVVAASANAAYGGELKFFKPEERNALKPWFAGLPPEGQAAAIGAIAANTSGPAREAAFKEITDGEPATVFAAGLFAQDPDVARGILQGAQAGSEYSPKKSPNVQSYQTYKQTNFPVSMFPVAWRTDPKGPVVAMSEAIDARYAYLSARAGDASGKVDEARVKQAANDVTGGIVSHNGASTIAPARGMTQSQFEGVVWGLKDEDLAGAQTSGGTAITADYLRSSAKLRSRSDGQYYLQLNQDDAKPQYAVTKAGAPFVLDLRNRKPGEVPAPGLLDAAAQP